ncbi:Putative rmlC-like cupin domain superfamily, rmlC-like jelly roll protein [Septoria linicola]|uniref:RmlC-like cupin domain superfamily, rmlC-like jelly roll protein n=1 Tax=Septoria linicola TaxID=215465 RepID=A0A9Q9AQ02_9PEZI|nr:Putative rmlC-like cupin domain superfamily, rmlC-like jelly roll protein [Septoria linicola]
MISFLRAPHPPQTNQADKDLTIYENGTSSVQYHAKGSQYMMTHTIPPTKPGEEPSIIQPPLHYHIYQKETFNVIAGQAHLFFGLDPLPSAVLSASGPSSTAVLGPMRYHRFENSSKTETLKINIQLDPEDYENESRFFRNFFGYLNDCKRAKQAPSVFQLFVFLWSADTPLAIPMPFGLETVGVYLSWVLMIVVAYVGMYGLGYKTSYPEYYEEGKKSK